MKKKVLIPIIAALVIIIVAVSVYFSRSHTLYQVLDGAELEVSRLNGTIVEMSDAQKSAILDILDDVTVRYAPWDVHGLGLGESYRVELTDASGMDVVDLRISDSGNSIFYIRGSDRTYRPYCTVSFPQFNELLTMVAELTQE